MKKQPTGSVTPNQIKAEAKRSKAAQVTLGGNPAARWEIEKRLMLNEVLPRILASASQKVQITGSATGVVIASGNASVNIQLTATDFAAILPRDEFMRQHTDLGAPQDQHVRPESAIRSVRQEPRNSESNPPTISGVLKFLKQIAVKVIENLAKRVVTDYLRPLLDRFIHLASLLTR